MPAQQPKFRHTLIRRTGIALLAASLVIRNPLGMFIGITLIFIGNIL